MSRSNSCRRFLPWPTPINSTHSKAIFLKSSCLTPGKYVWDLWWTKWHSKLTSPTVLRLPLSALFHQCSILMFHSSTNITKSYKLTSSLNNKLLSFLQDSFLYYAPICGHVFCVPPCIPIPAELSYTFLMFPMRATCLALHSNHISFRIWIIKVYIISYLFQGVLICKQVILSLFLRYLEGTSVCIS